jgi:uncharacterized protein with HEPN domain
MTPSPDEIRLRHMREAAEHAVGFVAARTRADLDDDEMLRLALTKLVAIVGEAAKLIGADTRSRYPAVAWTEAARMRDRLVHHYFDLDLDALWATITEDLPELLAALENILSVSLCRWVPRRPRVRAPMSASASAA